MRIFYSSSIRFTTCSSRCWHAIWLMSFSVHGYAFHANNCATWRYLSIYHYIMSMSIQIHIKHIQYSISIWNHLKNLFWKSIIQFSLFKIKGILKPLMELSASLDTYRPNSAALFRSLSANSKSELVNNDGNFVLMYFC